MEAMRKASWSAFLILCLALLATSCKVSYGQATSVTNRGNYETDTIYELMVDRFYDGDPSNNNPYNRANSYDSTGTNINDYFGGDWQGVINKMQYLQDMGITAIWITCPYDNLRQPYFQTSNSTYYNGYHGYWARDYFVPDAHWGSWAVFDNMVTSAHQHGIKVIIDFVTNHSNQNDIKVWLDHNIDGIRSDAVLHQDPAFLKIWQDYINAYKPVYDFGEFWISTPDSKYGDYKTFQARTGIGILDFELSNVMTGTFGTFSNTMNDLANTLGYTSSDYTYVNKAVPFLDSHDKERIASLQPNRGIEHAALAFLLTSRGTPVIYYGTEQYLLGVNGDGGRVPMPGYDNVRTGQNIGWRETTTAFQLIKKLAGLRKSNDAIAYGRTTVRWVNNDVIICERQFFNNVVLVAINRSANTAYSISGLFTNLPAGTYADYLSGLLGGFSITVASGGSVSAFNLGATQVAVWQVTNVPSTQPEIGAVGPTMGRAGDTVTIDGEGFGTTAGTVNFSSTAATIQSWSPTQIKVTVPSITPAALNVTVVANGNTSNAYRYDVLTGPQVMEIFHVNAQTVSGQNVYVVGSVHELDNWDAVNVYYSMFNPSYPAWFLPVSVPASTAIQYKYIKRDGSGNVIWQADPNLTLTTPASGEADTTTYVWP